MTDTSISIQSILSPELVLCGLPGSSKKKVLEEVAQYIAQQYPDINENTIFNWDGRDNLGKYLKTGIYLVSSYHPNKESLVSKLAIVVPG